MALDVNAIRNQILSHAAASGYFDEVSGHEPKNAPGNGLSCHCWLDRVEPYALGSGLQVTSALVVFNLRIMTNMISEPQDDIDMNLSDAASGLFTSYSGDFELGSNVRAIDLLGQTGTSLSLQAGYLNQDSKMYRAYVITLPVIVNDVWSQGP